MRRLSFSVVVVALVAPCGAAAQSPALAATDSEPSDPPRQSAPVDIQDELLRQEEQRLLAPLKSRISELAFEKMPLRTALEWLRDKLNLRNFHIRWSILADAGLDRDHPISLRAQNISGEQALRLILAEAGGSDLRLGFEAVDGMLIVSTAEDLGRELVTRVYSSRHHREMRGMASPTRLFGQRARSQPHGSRGRSRLEEKCGSRAKQRAAKT